MSRPNNVDEENFIVRMHPDVAARVRRILQEDPTCPPADKAMSLDFLDGDGREGVFTIGKDSFPATLLDLPRVVESFKTYNDTDLVKVANVGQMLLVRRPGDPPPESKEIEEGGSLRVESIDGLTPPLKGFRRRDITGLPPPEVTPESIQSVQKTLCLILSGNRPSTDDIQVVEEWVTDDED